MPNEYTERHHIIPKSLGGSDKKSNLVRLTYREHFLAHWLLTKFTRGKRKYSMLHALARMSHPSRGGRIISSWQYDVARRANRKAKIGNTHALGWKPSDETKLKISIKAKKRGTFSKEHCENLRLAHLGYKHTAKSIRKMRKNHHSNKGRHWSTETKKKISQSLTGRPRPLDVRQKQAKSLKKFWANKSNRKMMLEARL